MLTKTVRKFALGAAISMIASAANAADKVSVVVLPFLSQAPIFIALEEGYFEEQGIEIAPAEFRGWNAIVPGIVAGEFDAVTLSLQAGMINAVERGAGLRLAAPAISFAKQDCAYFAALGRDGVEWERLRTGEPLHVQFSTETASVNNFLSDRLATLPGAEGFSYEIKTIPPHVEIDGLKTGAIDMAFTTEPWILRAEKAQAATQLMTGADIFEDFQYAFIVLSERLVKDDPDLGRRFMAAISKAKAQYNEGKTARNVEIISKHTKIDPEFLKSACWANMPLDEEVDERSVMELQEWFVEKGYIDAVLPVDSISHRF